MKRYLPGILVGVLLTSLFLYSLILNITKPVGLTYVDASHVYFILKHLIDVFSSGNWSKLPTLPMLYGISDSLFFTDHHLFIGLLTYPLYLFTRDVITAVNLLMVITIFSSFFSMYLLIWHFSKRVLPSLLGSVIYVFNPFVSLWVPNYLLLFSLQFIPLIFLFLEKSLSNPNRKNTFLFFLFLTLQLIASSLYYSAFLTVILPIYVSLRIWQEKMKVGRIVNRGTIMGMLLFILVAVATAYPYIRIFSREPINRPLLITEFLHSAFVANWFFTSEANFVYGALLEAATYAVPAFFPYNNEEQSLFWGITPIIIFFLSFRILKKSSYRKYWLIFLGLLVFSMLLSFGPNIHLTKDISIPGPYILIYKINPLFSFLRVPARFALFVFFFLGLIIALTLTEISKKLHPGKAFLLFLVFLALTLVEYWNRPLEFVKIPSETKNFYKTLNSNREIKVVLDLPIANQLTGPKSRAEVLDAHYLLWATILHSKKLFNGYSSFLPQQYRQRANFLSIDFPTTPKLALLRAWGVDGIVLHEDEFKSRQDYTRIKTGLLNLKVPQIALANPPTGELTLFDLTKWELDKDIES